MLTPNRPPKHTSARRGIAQWFALTAAAMAAVATVAMMRTQTVALSVARNAAVSDAVLRAATAGFDDGLERMSAVDWTGVGSTLTETLADDTRGTLAYSVTWTPVDPASLEAALRIRITSTASWTPSDASLATVSAVASGDVELQPRVPGRTIGPTDHANATDIAGPNATFDAVRGYSMTLGTSGLSTIVPNLSVTGPVRTVHELDIFDGLLWSPVVEQEFLQGIGNELVSGSAYTAPHPLRGEVSHNGNVTADDQATIGHLAASHTNTPSPSVVPTLPAASLASYRLFDGGPLYTASLVSGTLSNVTLEPTAANPLGIFHATGPVTIGDNVRIHGTLAAEGAVTWSGVDSQISAVNGRHSNAVVGSNLWPQLPAVVADATTFQDTARVFIEGDVVLAGTATAEVSRWEPVSLTSVDLILSGTPIESTPLETTIEFAAGAIAGVSASDDAVYVSHDDGGWHPIRSVDVATSTINVGGSLPLGSAIACRITAKRTTSCDIRGRLIANQFDATHDAAWMLSTARWNTLHANYLSYKAIAGASAIEFFRWLEVPGNHLGGSVYHTSHGIRLDPTFRLRPRPSETTRWETPMFAAFPGDVGIEQHAGYRWAVLTRPQPSLLAD